MDRQHRSSPDSLRVEQDRRCQEAAFVVLGECWCGDTRRESAAFDTREAAEQWLWEMPVSKTARLLGLYIDSSREPFAGFIELRTAYVLGFADRVDVLEGLWATRPSAEAVLPFWGDGRWERIQEALQGVLDPGGQPGAAEKAAPDA